MSDRLIVSIAVSKASNLTPCRASLLGSIVLEDAVNTYSVVGPVSEESLVSFVRSLYREAQKAGLVAGMPDENLISGTLATV
jgi:hypothetical protein